MNTPAAKYSSATIFGGICFATMLLLLLVAYLPGFAPDAYIKLRRTGLISLVPMIASVGILAAIGTLLSTKETNERNF